MTRITPSSFLVALLTFLLFLCAPVTTVAELSCPRLILIARHDARQQTNCTSLADKAKESQEDLLYLSTITQQCFDVVEAWPAAIDPGTPFGCEMADYVAAFGCRYRWHLGVDMCVNIGSGDHSCPRGVSSIYTADMYCETQGFSMLDEYARLAAYQRRIHELEDQDPTCTSDIIRALDDSISESLSEARYYLPPELSKFALTAAGRMVCYGEGIRSFE